MTAIIDRRAIGTSGLSVSRLGFGGAPLGNLFRRITDQDAALTVQAALDAGISYFDTAPYYGFGLSERRLGDSIRAQPQVVISTKVGRLLQPVPYPITAEERDGFHSTMPFEPRYDYTHAGIMRSWESSLHRLGLARIDILLVHDIGAATHGEQSTAMFSQLTQGGGFRALEELRAAGEICALGLGVNEWPVCLQAMNEVRIDVVLLAGRYTLLEQEALEVFLPRCARQEVAVIAAGVYNSGILATGTRGTAVPYFNYAPAPAAIIERAASIESICERYGVSLPAAALQFVLAHPVVVSAVLGLGSPAQVAAALAALHAEIPRSFWQELRSQGLLRLDAPVPGDPVARSSGMDGVS